MEPPTPVEASAAIADAEAGRTSLAHHVVVPRLFFASIGAAVALQIGTTAVGLADGTGSPDWLLVAGLVVFAAVAGGQLVRFQRLNGVWLGGLLSGVWWLVPLCAMAGGVGYALSGLGWMRRYRFEPAVHSRGESAGWLALLGVLALACLVLLIAQR
jgi:hypothetical protein